jgi:hypothetical protein
VGFPRRGFARAIAENETRTHLTNCRARIKNAAEVDKREVVIDASFVARHEALEVLRPPEEPLNLPATRVPAELPIEGNRENRRLISRNAAPPELIPEQLRGPTARPA